MTAAEKGLLMLCSRLGDAGVTPLSHRQFHGLRKRISLLACESEKDLTETDLRAMGIPSDTAVQILRLLDRDVQLYDYLTAGETFGISTITRIHPDYPRVLEQKLRGSAPPVLFCKGDTSLFSSHCVALVGSRKLMETNRRFARKVGELAAKEGYTLVSGGAVGADFEAQQACLANGGSVIEFTPERLDQKKAHPHILYCSEEGWDLPFTSHRALGRNRLIHAMGEKTFVAQCANGHGGSWRGAEENLRNGYSALFVFWDGSEGAASLLSMGAVEVMQLHSVRELKTGQETFFV